MTDLDLLRKSLRERESLAPDATATLVKTHSILRRRRSVRRATALTATATVTTGVLVAGGLLMLEGDRPPVAVEPAASALPPARTVETAQSLPFTVGRLPAGFVLDSWALKPGEVSAQYVGNGSFETIVVRVRSQDPVAGTEDESRRINGILAVLRTVDARSGFRELSWQLSPGKWASIGGASSAITVKTLQEVAESVTARPSPVTATLSRIAVPQSMTLQAADGGSIDGPESFRFCPDGSAADGPACILVGIRAGTAPATWQRIGPGTVNDVKELPLKPSDGLLLTDDGQVVVRQINAKYWISVTSANATTATLKEIARSGVA
ncbi:hypothetical protein [Amycolatopsis sp. cmx-11-51]|uniref:hypothetical protein n=1 Tax=unclassified Amycolatopsis TaxID=2618356 RepID=UPI0039E283F9